MVYMQKKSFSFGSMNHLRCYLWLAILFLLLQQKRIEKMLIAAADTAKRVLGDKESIFKSAIKIDARASR
jgi:hypothetical protein